MSNKTSEKKVIRSPLPREIPIPECGTVLPEVPCSLATKEIEELDIKVIGLHMGKILERYANGEQLNEILPAYHITRWRWRHLLDANPLWQRKMNIAREMHIESLLEDTKEVIYNDQFDMLANQRTGAKYLNKEYVMRSKLKFEYTQWRIQTLTKMKFYKGDAKTLAEKAQLITSGMMNHEYSPEVACEYLKALELEAKIIESHDIAVRVKELEDAQNAK